nr:5344_t:CDS:2 [Entrophospora candida]
MLTELDLSVKSYFESTPIIMVIFGNTNNQFKLTSNLPIQFKVGLENLPTCLRDFINTSQKVGIDVDNLSTISIFKKLHFPDGTIARSDNSCLFKFADALSF